MKTSESAAMVPPATGAGRKLLVGRVAAAIEPGDVVVLVRGDGARYRLLRFSADPADPHDPLTLASFLLSEQVDEDELQTAIAMADEASRPSKKTPAKRPSQQHRRGAGT